jgi:hypothetical protein
MSELLIVLTFLATDCLSPDHEIDIWVTQSAHQPNTYYVTWTTDDALDEQAYNADTLLDEQELAQFIDPSTCQISEVQE